MHINKIFEKPFIPKTQKDPLFIPPQITTYRDSLNQDKKVYNYTAQKYIENIYRVQTFLNLNPRATNIKEPNTNYITQKLLGYNKLIALPKTNPSLIKTRFDYGLLNTIYTQDGEELTAMEELHKIFTTYKRIQKEIYFI